MVLRNSWNSNKQMTLHLEREKRLHELMTPNLHALGTVNRSEEQE
jgi:hypothetical protein